MHDEKGKHYTEYTLVTNNILSKNMALQCILTKVADNEKDDQGELLEAVLTLITEQGEEIDSYLTKIDSSFTCAFGRIASKNVGAAAMAEDLLEGNDKHGELIECLLTLIQSQFYDIQLVRKKYTE